MHVGMAGVPPVHPGRRPRTAPLEQDAGIGDNHHVADPPVGAVVQRGGHLVPEVGAPPGQDIPAGPVVDVVAHRPRFRRVGDRATVDHAGPGRDRADRAEGDDAGVGYRPHRPFAHLQCVARVMRLEIEVGGIQHLPDAVEIAVAGLGRRGELRDRGREA